MTDESCGGRPVAWSGDQSRLGGRQTAHLRHHLAPGRGQDHPDREVPALRRRPDQRGRRGQGPNRAPLGHLGLDGARAAARHLHHLDRAPVPLPPTGPARRRADRQPARHPGPPRLLRGHLPGAGRGRRRGHGARRGQGHRAPDPEAVRRVPPARPAAAQLHQQVGPARARPARAARRDRAPDRPGAHPGDLAGRHRRRLPGRDRPARRPVHPLHPRGPRRHRGARGAGRRPIGPRPRRARPGRPRSTRSRCSTGSGPSSTTRPSWPASPPRSSSARPSPTSACASCSTRWSSWCRRRRPAPTSTGVPRALDAPFSGFVFKVAGQHGPVPPRPHRLPAGVLGPLRAGHGRDPRGAPASPSPPSTPTRSSARSARRSTRPSPATWSGLVNATDVRVGDTPVRRRAGHLPGHPQLRPRALQRGPGARHRPLQAVPPGHRPARRGGRGAGAARPRPGRPGPDAGRGRAHAVRGGRAPAGERVRRPGRAAARRRTGWPGAPTRPAPRP